MFDLFFFSVIAIADTGLFCGHVNCLGIQLRHCWQDNFNNFSLFNDLRRG